MKFLHHPQSSLNGEWQMAHSPHSHHITCIADLEKSGLEILPAQVPGNLELDLWAAGKIGDPFAGMNIAGLRALENHHVWYARRFHVSPVDHHEPVLRFEGSDCYAKYYLNGQLLDESDNALVEHEFAAGHLLREGANEIALHFRPAVLEAKKYPYNAGVEAFPANYESLYVRKAPHCFGWDIMPRALSAGLWRDVSLVWQPAERLEEVFLETLSCNQESAVLRLFYRGHFNYFDGDYSLEIEGHGTKSTFHHRQKVLFEAGQCILNIGRPELWWPHGRGDAHLYEVTVRLLTGEKIVDGVEFRHGIQSVKLERTSLTNEKGEGEFCFRVNGEKMFVMGTNHVPLDAYHSRDLQHTEKYLQMARELGCNMLRCWGGNVYESDLFFDLCDENGILVWQDFSMACAAYPQDVEFQKRFADEACKVIKRLRENACLALWAGDNECDSSGFRNERQNYDPNQNILTRAVLPRLIKDHDPGREYLPSSPYIDETAKQKGLHYLPEHHPWGPRDYFKSDYYQNILCHFASEIGYHGCPSSASVQRFISPGKLWPPHKEEWLLHATSPVPGVDLYDYRVKLMKQQIRTFFGEEPDSLEEFSLMSQIVQAEAKKFFIEFFRTGKWRRTGILWWNLRDGWPQFSDAVVDYYFEKKLAYYFIQRAQQPLLLAFREPDNGSIQLVACNDTRQNLNIHYSVKDITSGALIQEATANAELDAVTPLALVPYDAKEQCLYMIEWQSELGASKNHYLAGAPPFDTALYQDWYRKIYSSFFSERR